MNTMKLISDKVRAKERIVVICLLLGVCIIFPLLIFNRIRFYQLPVGGDVGNWLKTSYVIFENNYPMWGDSPFQTPPLLFFIIYPTARIMGEIWAMNAIGLFLLALRPLAVFFFINKMFKSRFFALLGASMDAFFPSYYEMYSFGGYPNLLGFIVLPIAFIYIFENSQYLKPKNFIVLFLFSTIVVFTHHLTSIIFLGIICLWSLERIFKKQFKLVFLILFTAFLPMIIYRLAVSGASEYVFFNEFAYYGCTINTSKILNIFKDLVLLLFLMILSFIGIYKLFKSNKSGAYLLLSWLLFPVIFYVGIYYTKIMAFDYARLLYFIIHPLIISTVYSFKILWNRMNRKIVLGLTCIILVVSFNYGFVTSERALLYNKSVLENKYSDINSYNTVMWIKQNLPVNSTIVTRCPIINRFIEGIAHKRVLWVASPKFLNKYNQYERCLVAESLLTYNILGYSDMFIIKDRTPILYGRTPYIYMFAGIDYKPLGYFSDHSLELKKLTLNATEINIYDGFYEITYNSSTVKKVVLRNDEVQISYTISREKSGKPLESNFWLPWVNWKFEDNHTLVTDYGDVDVITNAISIRKEYVPMWKQWRLIFTFDSDLSVTFKVKDIRMVKGNTILTTSNDLIKQYGVTHALIRVNDEESMRWVEALGWKIIYNNDLFYLYDVRRTPC